MVIQAKNQIVAKPSRIYIRNMKTPNLQSSNSYPNIGHLTRLLCATPISRDLLR